MSITRVSPLGTVACRRGLVLICDLSRRHQRALEITSNILPRKVNRLVDNLNEVLPVRDEGRSKDGTCFDGRHERCPYLRRREGTDAVYPCVDMICFSEKRVTYNSLLKWRRRISVFGVPMLESAGD